MTFKSLGLISFPLFKLVATIISVIMYLSFLFKFLKTNLISSFKFAFTSLLVPVSIIVLSFYVVEEFLPTDKSTINLISTVLYMGFCFLIGLLISEFLVGVLAGILIDF